MPRVSSEQLGTLLSVRQAIIFLQNTSSTEHSTSDNACGLAEGLGMIYLEDAPEAQAVAGGDGIVVGGNSDGDAQQGCHADGCCDLQQVNVQHLHPHPHKRTAIALLLASYLHVF